MQFPISARGRSELAGEKSPSRVDAQRLFGISDKRAATLAKWADEALRAVESSPRKSPVKAAKRGPKRAASKRTAKKKPSAKRSHSS